MDASWTDGLSAENATKCDPLRELCQSYVFAELLDAAGKVALPGFSIAEAEVTAVPLKWNNSSPPAEGWRAHVGQEVALRVTFRDAVIYSLGTGG